MEEGSRCADPWKNSALVRISSWVSRKVQRAADSKMLGGSALAGMWAIAAEVKTWFKFRGCHRRKQGIRVNQRRRGEC